MTGEKIQKLVSSEGKTRVVELDDGVIQNRTGGSVSWRNNNPGNLKFVYANSADKTVHSARSKAEALEDARKLYQGVVGLDQWGNAVFESYEAGRAAKIKLLEKKHGGKTVEEMLHSYSTADYTGSTHHQAQADFIYREGKRQGLDLHGKTIKQMSSVELAALADGIKGFEGWKVGTTSVLHSRLPLSPSDAASTVALDEQVPASNRQEPVVAASHDPIYRNHAVPDTVLKHGAVGRGVREFQESLRSLGYHGADQRPLSTDGNFGPNTKHAIQSFQRAHHLHVDGIVGKDTRAALKDAQHAPLLSEATNPHHHLYAKILHGMHKLPQDTYRNEQERANAAVALTISAHVQGLKDIDHVVLGRDGTNLFAVRGRMDDPAHRRVHVDHAQAMSRSMDHGTPALQVSQVRQPMHDMQAAMQATQAMHSQIEQHGPALGISR